MLLKHFSWGRASYKINVFLDTQKIFSYFAQNYLTLTIIQVHFMS